jgi:hypothetical protein
MYMVNPSFGMSRRVYRGSGLAKPPSTLGGAFDVSREVRSREGGSPDPGSQPPAFRWPPGCANGRRIVAGRYVPRY